ncbi:DsbA family oxidoreductase [Brachybacterium sacelli]|uniref:DsbA family dithiol-disulfide isomerase n=1 Tax=Brachybacterium sacelli TaxID=173364 RepID=A0ABS4X0Y1_9MICO|nr:DsbA family protein [Brachybacterium sacelli]MBP2381384.1 putative DsbA family dithiol-disulfide isomerase [Brachybacterium sacelli]
MTSTGTELHVWADIRCPWCWMGHRRIAAAITRTGVPARVAHRSYLLEPQGPATGRRLVRDLALSVWGLSSEEWAGLRDRIQRSAREDGLTIRMDSVRAIDSRDAHRVLALVAARGLDTAAAWDAMFAAHLEHHHDLEDWDQLVRIGVQAGLDPGDVRALAESDDFVTDVLDDHHEARSRDVGEVPAVVCGARQLSGARSVHELETFVRSAASGAVA